MSKRAAYERENAALTAANTSLRDQVKKLKADHRVALKAKNDQLRALRESWELFDTFGNLHRLILLLDKVKSADTTLRSPIGGSPAAEPTSQAERGAFPDPDRSRTARADRRLGSLADAIEQWMSPKGPLVEDEGEGDPKQRCYNPDCPARLIPQAFDREICYECKVAFTEFRPGAKTDNRCWTRECDQYGKTDQCQHSWQKMGGPADTKGENQ